MTFVIYFLYLCGKRVWVRHVGVRGTHGILLGSKGSRAVGCNLSDYLTYVTNLNRVRRFTHLARLAPLVHQSLPRIIEFPYRALKNIQIRGHVSREN